MPCTAGFSVAILTMLSFVAKGSFGESRCNRKMDLMVIMDGTISLGYNYFDNEKLFVANVLSNLAVGQSGVQVGIIQLGDRWSTKVEMELGKLHDITAVKSLIGKIEYGYGYRTLTGMALEMANKQFFGKDSRARPGTDKVLLLVTDGNPGDHHKAKHQVKLLKQKNVQIVTVAIATRTTVINRHRYSARTMATSYEKSFSSDHKNLQKWVPEVVTALCRNSQPAEPVTPLEQKCFQEKKDIVFAVDGSARVDENVFRQALAFISQICGKLDITASLIHIGLMQYSNHLNTRIEFDLSQYTKYYQVNDSLKNIVPSQEGQADLENALMVINEEMFTGKNGDRISAEDFLLLFVNDEISKRVKVLRVIDKLKRKGVHVIVIGLGKRDEEMATYYERLATHPSDVSYIDNAETKHIVGDLAATTCRKVNCKQDKVMKDKKQKEESGCKQQKQDVLFMIDGSNSMYYHYHKALKFLARMVKKFNIAATNTHVGLMQFGDYGNTKLHFGLGKYKFENDIKNRIEGAMPRYRRYFTSDIANALRLVNKEVFNTSTGGHRKDANDLIVIATRGSAYKRWDIQNQVRLLKDRGVTIAVLDVGYKRPVRRYQNIMHDIASGPREVFPLDFKRLSKIAQALLDVECKVETEKVSPRCFDTSRKVLFMLDSSEGMTNEQGYSILNFIEATAAKLYTDPHNIAIGLLQYSDKFTAEFDLELKKRPVEETLTAIRYLRLRKGSKNFVGNALRTVNKYFHKDHLRAGSERIVILVTHSEPADPEKAFIVSEKLKRKGVEIITIAIHMEKKSTNINQQYKVLASSRANAHSIDFNNLMQHTNGIVLNVCELNTCPKDSTKDCKPMKQDIFMVIDSSRSIGSSFYPRLRRFVGRLVNKLDIARGRTHVGIMQASDRHRTQYEMKLGEYRDPKIVMEIINDMGFQQGSASFIGTGLQTAIEDSLFNGTSELYRHKDRLDAENILIIFTDGVFHDEYLAKKVVSALKKRGVRVVTVGLGRQSRKPQAKELLESVASSRSDVYLLNLDKGALLVENELNEVVQHVTTLNCTNIYQAPPECSPEKLDVFVVIDGSKSVGWRNFGKVQNFLRKLADEFDIGHEKAHFGVMQFGASKQTRIEFPLDMHANNREVNKAITNMTFLSSYKTDTGAALSMVRKKVFNGRGGDRSDVPNILILFTDGWAHDLKRAYNEASYLKKHGTRIIGIGAGKKVRSFFHQIRAIASTDQDAHKSKFSELSGIVDDLLDVVCR